MLITIVAIVLALAIGAGVFFLLWRKFDMQIPNAVSIAIIIAGIIFLAAWYLARYIG